MNPDDQAQNTPDTPDTPAPSVTPDTQDTPSGPDQVQPPIESVQAVPVAPVQASVYCVKCGYNLSGVVIGSTCPECGQTVAPSFHGQVQPTSGKAIASLVLGICSIPACLLYGIPAVICGCLAIFFAQKAKGQLEPGQADMSSMNMATAGLICGIIGLCLGLLYVVLFGAIIVFAIYSNP